MQDIARLILDRDAQEAGTAHGDGVLAIGKAVRNGGVRRAGALVNPGSLGPLGGVGVAEVEPHIGRIVLATDDHRAGVVVFAQVDGLADPAIARLRRDAAAGSHSHGLADDFGVAAPVARKVGGQSQAGGRVDGGDADHRDLAALDQQVVLADAEGAGIGHVEGVIPHDATDNRDLGDVAEPVPVGEELEGDLAVAVQPVERDGLLHAGWARQARERVAHQPKAGHDVGDGFAKALAACAGALHFAF